MATRSAIATQIAQNVTDNTNFENTPARVRDVLNNINNSSLNYDTDVVSGGYSKNAGNVTVATFQALANDSGLIPNAFYRITNSSYGQSLLVQASASNDVWENATAVESGTTGSYDHLTDTFTPFASSGEFTPTLTDAGSNTRVASKMLYQKIGKVVNISGTIEITTDNNKNSTITFTTPFAIDNTKDSAFCCTLADALQYDILDTGAQNLDMYNNAGVLTLLLKTPLDDSKVYNVRYTGQYMTT